MLYAILAYHVEAEVMSWTPEQDAALMVDLLAVHDRLNAHKLLGPAARLGGTGKARTLRGPGAGTVLDGPFAETKEQLLGFYVVDCASEDAALDVARDLQRVNPSAVYEIRPISLYIPGAAIPETAVLHRRFASGLLTRPADAVRWRRFGSIRFRSGRDRCAWPHRARRRRP
jgi:hypothetical protein